MSKLDPLDSFKKDLQIPSQFSEESFWANDHKLNRAILDISVLSFHGFITGTILSLFFKRKQFFRSLGAGFGAGYAFYFNFRPELKLKK